MASSSRPGRRLGRRFFDRPTRRVARELLGASLTVIGPDGARSVRLVETEAYVAHDPASHAFAGETRRNRSMFGPPGTLYVYRIHQVVCANLVTRSGEAVLLRAGALPHGDPLSASGPGRLCRALGLTIEDDGVDAARGNRVRVYARRRPPARVVVGPRVGIRRAAEARLRYAIAGEVAVSRPRPVGWGAIGASPRRSRADGARRRSRRRRRRPSGGGRRAGRTGGR